MRNESNCTAERWFCYSLWSIRCERYCHCLLCMKQHSPSGRAACLLSHQRLFSSSCSYLSTRGSLEFTYTDTSTKAHGELKFSPWMTKRWLNGEELGRNLNLNASLDWRHHVGIQPLPGRESVPANTLRESDNNHCASSSEAAGCRDLTQTEEQDSVQG